MCASYRWGTVNRNASFANIYDANRAWVFDDVTPSLSELRTAMEQAQHIAPVDFTQVEVVDTIVRGGLMAELSAWLGPPSATFALMVSSETGASGPASRPKAIVVAERPFPVRERWLELLLAGHAQDDGIPLRVVGEMATRDIGVLALAGMRLFTATLGAETIGYATLWSRMDVGLIDNVATLPAFRRRGVATAVVTAALAASREAGDGLTCLFTREESSAQRLYEDLGMRSVARVAQFHAGSPRGTCGWGTSL
ncbi:MAG: GNAT family N-acetyltransferase [Candidatus Dormibacteraeota bacterium]|nr:GNAT family N-acetyltransferase [Candidatus Dormibacteraeota bacterium]